MIAAPTPITTPFAQAGDRDTIPLVFNPAFPGKAAFDVGFPPRTRMSPSTGGIPPSGLDQNGILFALSNNLAWIAAGGSYAWSAAYVAAWTGYPIGAILRSSANPLLYWYNTAANNALNPDVDPTGWLQFSILSGPTGVQTAVLAAGNIASFAVTNAGVAFVDLNPSAGNSTIQALTDGAPGQQVVFTNVHAANSVTINAAASIRLPDNIVLPVQYSSITLKFSAALDLWVPV